MIKDGDLLLLIKDMLSKRGLNTIRITKVEGHAGDERVPLGAVKQVDKDGNDRADQAADQGRRYAGAHVMDAQWDVCFHKLVIFVVLFFMTCVGFSFL